MLLSGRELVAGVSKILAELTVFFSFPPVLLWFSLRRFTSPAPAIGCLPLRYPKDIWCQRMICSRIAFATICVRLTTSSFFRIVAVCELTVCSETETIRAISLAVLP